MTETFKIKMKKPEREFVKVYKDFLKNQVLTAEEKIIYISLKYFVEYGKDEGEVYPSMETLCKLSSLSKPRATRTISSLIKKGIVKKNRRGLNKTNEYTLMDNCLMWASDTEEELKELASTEITFSTEELLEELQRRGAIEIVKEKVPETSEPTKAPEVPSTTNNIISSDYKANESNCQEVQSIVEQYPLEQIKEHFCYEAMVHDNPLQKDDIDSVINILYDALNTTKETIRVNKVNRPTTTVIGRLMKLTHLEIMYAIEMYKKQTERVNLSDSYMLTLLYKAKEQMHLNTTNKVQYDMAHQNHQNQTEEIKGQQQNYEENQSVNPMEQAIEVCKNYSKEQEDEYKERYKKTALQGINKEGFDKQEAISDLEKEGSNQNQGTSLPSDQQRIQSNEESIEVKAITKSEENCDDYEQRQYSQEFMDDLEVKLLALSGSPSD